MLDPRVATWIDLRDLLPDGATEVPPKMLRRATHLQRIIRTATVLPRGPMWSTAIRCPRRPDRRPCRGDLRVAIEAAGIGLSVMCPVCGDNAVLLSWQDWGCEPKDLDDPAIREVRLSRRHYDRLCSSFIHDAVQEESLAAAISVGDEVALYVTHDQLESLAEVAASEANHPETRAAGRAWDAVSDALEVLLDG